MIEPREHTGNDTKVIDLLSLKPNDILSEEEVWEAEEKRDHTTHPFTPAFALAEHEPRRTYELTRARLRKILVGPLFVQRLLVAGPPDLLGGDGLAVVWTIGTPDQHPLRVVCLTREGRGESYRLDEKITEIPADRVADCRFLDDKILARLPSWAR